MISTYNYLVSTYYSKPASKVTASHDKKELKDVYNNILKLNRESPLYMFDLSEDNQAFALNVKESAYSLSSIIKNLSEDSDIYSKSSYTSSSPGVSLVSVNNKKVENEADEFFITVDNLATAQKNVGKSVQSGNSSLMPGQYGFDITINNNTFSFQFPISEKKSNYAIQESLVNFINSTGIGIKAQLHEDSKGSKSYISLECESTGCLKDGVPAFTLEDTSTVNSRGIVEYFNLNNIETEAKNAHFNLNGINRSTHANIFTYNDTFTLQLNEASDEPVLITKCVDSEKVMSALNDFTTTYNTLVDTAVNSNSSGNKTSKLLTSLHSSSSYFINSLESCGVTFDNTGHMVVNKTLAYQAADLGDLKDLLTDKNMMSDIKAKADSISLNPMDFVNKTIVTYPNLSKPAVNNPYVTSIYSGMLFNHYC